MRTADNAQVGQAVEELARRIKDPEEGRASEIKAQLIALAQELHAL